MKKYSNPLDNIKIASPCPADWEKMYGDERNRHCSQCNLNVYNLSDMTRREAENFLMNAEDRVCVKYYKRKDGTVLTKDCPVGWRLLKKRVSRVTTAVFASVFGLFTGLIAFQQFETNPLDLMNQVVVETDNSHLGGYTPIVEEPENLDKIKNEIDENIDFNDFSVGRVENMGTLKQTRKMRKLKKDRVIAWIQ